MKINDISINELRSELSKSTFEIFNCFYEKLLYNKSNNQIEINSDLNKDYVRISLKSNTGLKFSFSFFSGYVDFFIDDNHEVFIQKKFKNISKASDYFNKCLFSKIQKIEYFNAKKDLIGIKYFLIRERKEELLCGELMILNVLKKPKNKKSEVHAPMLF